MGQIKYQLVLMEALKLVVDTLWAVSLRLLATSAVDYRSLYLSEISDDPLPKTYACLKIRLRANLRLVGYCPVLIFHPLRGEEVKT
jgi:hypothetical protein